MADDGGPAGGMSVTKRISSKVKGMIKRKKYVGRTPLFAWFDLDACG